MAGLVCQCKNQIFLQGNNYVQEAIGFSTVSDSLTNPRYNQGSSSSGGPTMGRSGENVGLIAWTTDMGEHADNNIEYDLEW